MYEILYFSENEDQSLLDVYQQYIRHNINIFQISMSGTTVGIHFFVLDEVVLPRRNNLLPL